MRSRSLLQMFKAAREQVKALEANREELIQINNTLSTTIAAQKQSLEAAHSECDAWMQAHSSLQYQLNETNVQLDFAPNANSTPQPTADVANLSDAENLLALWSTLTVPTSPLTNTEPQPQSAAGHPKKRLRRDQITSAEIEEREVRRAKQKAESSARGRRRARENQVALEDRAAILRESCTALADMRRQLLEENAMLKATLTGLEAAEQILASRAPLI